MIVAEIGKDDVITLPEVQRLIQNTVRGRSCRRMSCQPTSPPWCSSW